jgi:signal transduction histidine kinase
MTRAEMHGLDANAVRVNRLDLVERVADDLAHEIKNPLHSMVINLEVLRRRIARNSGEHAEELLRYAGILSAELERVSRRVEILLRLVRPDRAADPVSLAETVEDLLEVVALENERRRVELAHETPELPVPGHIERRTARHLVLNLLLSALDLTAEGGTIRVRTESYGGAERLRIEISPPARPGTALGAATSELAVATALAERVGGTIETDGSADTIHLLLTVDSPSG